MSYKVSICCGFCAAGLMPCSTMAYKHKRELSQGISVTPAYSGAFVLECSPFSGGVGWGWLPGGWVVASVVDNKGLALSRRCERLSE